MARLVLAEGTGALGTALYAFLTKLPGIDEVVRVENQSELQPLVNQTHPDFILLSTRLMGEELLPTIAGLMDARPDVKVLVASTDNDSRLALRVLEAGAHGYLLVDHAVEELERAIGTLLRNRTYLSPGIAGAPRHTQRGADRDRGRISEAPVRGGLLR